MVMTFAPVSTRLRWSLALIITFALIIPSGMSSKRDADETLDRVRASGTPEPTEDDLTTDKEARDLVTALQLDNSGMDTFMKEYWSHVAAMLPAAPKSVLSRVQKEMFSYALSDYHSHSLDLKTRVFKEHFTPAEIHSLSQWFQSALGAKSLKAFPEIIRDLSRLHHRYVLELIPEVAQELELLGYSGSMDDLALPTLGLQSATDLGVKVAPAFAVKIIRLLKMLRPTIRPELGSVLAIESLHHLHFGSVPKDLFKNVREKVFAHINQKLEHLNVKVMANHFTEKEVESLIHFYSSPVGTKIEQDLPGITAETMHLFFPYLIKKLPVLLQKYKQELRSQGHGSAKWDPELTKAGVAPASNSQSSTTQQRYERSPPAQGVPKHVVTKVVVIVATFVITVLGLVFYFREQIIDGLTFGGKDSHHVSDGL
eukprot:TRINITY_DN40256_c0_g1_i1.p1 TRINITY_DN40256_c0_g1~~TRINITY_DN40256_c0_g1_i1.p1  ORF type:complete len:427 (+),score=39.29 TRINITY_DN40256_c0_g1_i1:125-1405(+)